MPYYPTAILPTAVLEFVMVLVAGGRGHLRLKFDLQYPRISLFLQILLEPEDECMGEVHPLLDTVHGKEVPIAVVVRQGNEVLRRSIEEAGKLRWLAVDHRYHLW